MKHMCVAAALALAIVVPAAGQEVKCEGHESDASAVTVTKSGDTIVVDLSRAEVVGRARMSFYLQGDTLLSETLPGVRHDYLRRAGEPLSLVRIETRTEYVAPERPLAVTAMAPGDEWRGYDARCRRDMATRFVERGELASSIDGPVRLIMQAGDTIDGVWRLRRVMRYGRGPADSGDAVADSSMVSGERIRTYYYRAGRGELPLCVTDESDGHRRVYLFPEAVATPVADRELAAAVTELVPVPLPATRTPGVPKTRQTPSGNGDGRALRDIADGVSVESGEGRVSVRGINSAEVVAAYLSDVQGRRVGRAVYSAEGVDFESLTGGEYIIYVEMSDGRVVTEKIMTR